MSVEVLRLRLSGQNLGKKLLAGGLGFQESNSSLNLTPVTPTRAPQSHRGCFGATERKPGALPFHVEVCKLQDSGPRAAALTSVCTAQLIYTHNSLDFIPKDIIEDGKQHTGHAC